jgi:beta-lactamase regulating signal transducer with metallopeptidase domain
MVFTLARASMDGALLVVAIWAAICLLDRVLRLSPATRALLWWCAAAKFVVALTWTTPVNIPILPAEPAVHRVVGGASPRVEQFTLGSDRTAQRQRAATGGWDGALREWSTFATVGWTMGLLIVGAVGVRRWRDTVRLRDASSPANGALQAHAVELAAHLRLKRVPEVRVSPGVDTPLVTGLLRPVVLLPADRFEVLTDREQQMAICHELAHVKRADLWLGCVPALAERLFFFHPLVRLAAREYALSREAACDSAVMDTLEVAPQDYGRLLLALGVSRPRTGLTAAGAAWSFPNLKRRIAMLQNQSARSTRSRALAVAVVGLAITAMVPMQLAARRPVIPSPGNRWSPSPRRMENASRRASARSRNLAN